MADLTPDTLRHAADEILDHPWQLEAMSIRLHADAWAKDRLQIDEAMAVLQPNMPESGLVDACRQVKQVAISEADNAERLEADLKAETEENNVLREKLAALNGQTCGTCRHWDRGNSRVPGEWIFSPNHGVCGLDVRSTPAIPSVLKTWGCRSWTAKEGA